MVQLGDVTVLSLHVLAERGLREIIGSPVTDVGMVLLKFVTGTFGGILRLAVVAAGSEPDSEQGFTGAVMLAELGDEVMRILGLEWLEDGLRVVHDAVLETFKAEVIFRIVQPLGHRVAYPAEKHRKPL